MLETIEASIKNLPSISFEEFYMHYIDDVEKEMIDQEVKRMQAILHDRKSLARIERSIDSLLKGVEDLI